jgi:hypothetical protein
LPVACALLLRFVTSSQRRMIEMVFHADLMARDAGASVASGDGLGVASGVPCAPPFDV